MQEFKAGLFQQICVRNNYIDSPEVNMTYIRWTINHFSLPWEVTKKRHRRFVMSSSPTWCKLTGKYFAIQSIILSPPLVFVSLKIQIQAYSNGSFLCIMFDYVFFLEICLLGKKIAEFVKVEFCQQLNRQSKIT